MQSNSVLRGSKRFTCKTVYAVVVSLKFEADVHVRSFFTTTLHATYLLLNTGPIMLTPNYGHLFGGTPVLVSGPYFTTTDNITCQFGDVIMAAMYINEGEVLCVSPRLEKIGETPFIVYVVASDGVTSRFDSTFNTSKFPIFSYQ